MGTKRFTSIILTVILVLASFTIPASADQQYERFDDDFVYDAALGDFEKLMDQAAETDDINERFVRYAKAEAALLDSAVVIPTKASGGAYSMTRIAPHTISDVMWGNDKYRYGYAVVSSDLISVSEREEMISLWQEALKGNGTYDPAAYLTSKGHALSNQVLVDGTYKLSTLDWSAAMKSYDHQVLTNLVDGLIRYDNFGNVQPALAKSWTVSEDGLTYTFTLRDDVNWYSTTGSVYAPLKAADFVTGFKRSLDLNGSAALTKGVIQGASEYLAKEADFSVVGFKAPDEHTVVITLTRRIPYFLSYLSYNIFYPVCGNLVSLIGDNYGSMDSTYYQVYCGPFVLQYMDEGSIYLVKNPDYYGADNISVELITFTYTDGSDALLGYNYVKDGLASSSGLNDMAVAQAKNENYFDTYVYVDDLGSSTFYANLNLNRGAFECTTKDPETGEITGVLASPKTEAEKISYANAVSNKNFRKALMRAINRAEYLAPKIGEDLKYNAIRNTITPGYFVTLSESVTLDGKTFAAGTSYGEIVQYYLYQLGDLVDVSDGKDGWYDAHAAQSYLALAVEELGDSVTYPIVLDYVTWDVTIYNDQAQAVKNSVESALGSDKVVVNIISGDMDLWLNSVYYAGGGESFNTDFNDMNGWGPDYADPSTYLDIFRKSSEMIRFFGVSEFDGEYPPGISVSAKKGDIDSNGAVDSDDLVALARHIAKIEIITDPVKLNAADTDGSGSVDADDLTVLSRYVAGIISEFPEPNIEEYEVS